MYTCANFLNDYEIVLCQGKELLILDLNNLNILRKIEEKDNIEFLSVSEDKKWTFTKVGQNLNKWDLETGECISFHNPDYFEVYKVITDNENKFLFCAGETHTLVWNIESKKLIQKLETANYANDNYLLSLDNKNELLLTSDRECNLFFWNIKTWVQEDKINLRDFIYSADHDDLAWDFRLSSFSLFNPQNNDEVFFVFPASNEISKFSIKNRKLNNKPFIKTDNIIYFMDLNDKKSLLITVGVYSNSYLKLFDIETGKGLQSIELGKFLRVDAVSLNEFNNKVLISGFYGSFLYDLNSGKLIKQLSETWITN